MIQTSPGREIGVSHLRHRILIGLASLSGSSPAISSASASASKPVMSRSKPSSCKAASSIAQHRIVPAGVLGDAVVRDHQGAALRRRQVIEHDHRHRLQPELLRGGQPPWPATMMPSLPPGSDW